MMQRIIRNPHRIKACASCQHAHCVGDVKQPCVMHGVQMWVDVVICDKQHCKWEPVTQ